MLKEARGFGAATNDNKILKPPYAACRSESGDRWVITAWEPCQRAWANPPVPCIHSDPQVPDCPPGGRREVRGWLSFYQGTDLDAELARIDATGWRSAGSDPIDIGRFREKAARWEEDVRALEALGATESHPAGSILFAGSSSIRLWGTIDEDMAPYHPVRRGYGGASLADLVFYIDRITAPHTFRALVVFAGNDIAGQGDDRTPAEVAALFRHLLGTVRTRFPETPVFYIAVTPTPSRWAVWPQAREANQRIQALCEEVPHTHFIATESTFLDPDGQPRPGLFRDDRLHLNETGYDLWAAVIKSHLDSVLGGASEPVE
jgi:hypothetical protein